MEIESALVAHPMVAEAAVVGRPDDIKGQAVSAFVTLEGGVAATPALKDELRAWVTKEIGSMAKPDDIRFTEQLPKTRSGKIMRRLLARTRHQRRSERRHHYPGRLRGNQQTEEQRRIVLARETREAQPHSERDSGGAFVWCADLG